MMIVRGECTGALVGTKSQLKIARMDLLLQIVLRLCTAAFSTLVGNDDSNSRSG